jgi:hypothetical protein
MMLMRTPRPEVGSEPDAEHRDKMLDEALQETFPASDPIAITIDKPLKYIASEDQGPENRATSARTTFGGTEPKPALTSFYDANLWSSIKSSTGGRSCSGAAVANNIWKRPAIE